MIDYHIVFVKKKKHFFNVLHYNFIHFFLLIRKISTCNSKSEFIFYKLNLSEITPFKRNRIKLFFFITVIMSLRYNYCIAVAIEHSAFFKNIKYLQLQLLRVSSKLVLLPKFRIILKRKNK